MKRLNWYWHIVRGFLMIRLCPARYRAGVMAMLAAWMEFDGYAGPAALAELAAKQSLPKDVGEIIAIVQCDCGLHSGTTRIRNSAYEGNN